MSNSVFHAADAEGRIINIAEQLTKRVGEFADVIHKHSREALREKDQLNSCADIVCEVVGLGSGLATVLDHHCGSLVRAGVLSEENRAYIRRALFDVIGHLQLEAVARIHGKEVPAENLRMPIAEGAALSMDGEILDQSFGDASLFDDMPVDKSKLN